MNYNNEKKNILVSEKYVQAGLYLKSNDKNNAKLLFEEIILSKNEIYSILALNTIIEKKLISNEKEVLNYFNIIEKSISDKEYKDLIKLKKALYLQKISDIKNSKILLRNLVEKNSSLKPLAQELLEE
tara:strand:+ start:62 stop:445 length:384 start_codon:yes stop_codon:yes gene_type:complete